MPARARAHDGGRAEARRGRRWSNRRVQKDRAACSIEWRHVTCRGDVPPPATARCGAAAAVGGPRRPGVRLRARSLMRSRRPASRSKPTHPTLQACGAATPGAPAWVGSHSGDVRDAGCNRCEERSPTWPRLRHDGHEADVGVLVELQPVGDLVLPREPHVPRALAVWPCRPGLGVRVETRAVTDAASHRERGKEAGEPHTSERSVRERGHAWRALAPGPAPQGPGLARRPPHGTCLQLGTTPRPRCRGFRGRVARSGACRQNSCCPALPSGWAPAAASPTAPGAGRHRKQKGT